MECLGGVSIKAGGLGSTECKRLGSSNPQNHWRQAPGATSIGKHGIAMAHQTEPSQRKVNVPAPSVRRHLAGFAPALYLGIFIGHPLRSGTRRIGSGWDPTCNPCVTCPRNTPVLASHFATCQIGIICSACAQWRVPAKAAMSPSPNGQPQVALRFEAEPRCLQVARVSHARICKVVLPP